MKQPIEVLLIVGSLRDGSYNRMLARAAEDESPDHVTFNIADISRIPLYNEDVRNSAGVPESVGILNEAMRSADATLYVSPEYNYSVPGVLKNAIDWASDGSDHPFKGHPTAIMGASTGRFGSVRMQGDLRVVLAGLGALVLAKPEVMITSARAKFDKEGRLTDERSRKQVRELVLALAEWVVRVAPE